MKNVSILILLNLILFAKGTKIPTDVLDLNDKFVDVANEGSWFIKVRRVRFALLIPTFLVLRTMVWSLQEIGAR